MQLSKSYKLLEFLNRRHGWVTRNGFAAGGWLGAMATTRSPLLANALRREFANDQFDTACRRAVRYARYFSPRLTLFHDPFFDFTTGTSERERRALEHLLERKRPFIAQTDYLADLLYLRAADIHQRLEANINADSAANEFYELADQLLEATMAMRPSPASAPSATPQKPQNFDRGKATQALRDVAALLPPERWPWYIVSGTLLGLHREGSFLGHDLDMDIAFNAEDVDPNQLVACLSQSQHFHIKRIHSHYDIQRSASGHRTLQKRLALIQLVHRDGTQVDVFLYHLENGVRWHGSVIHHWENTPFTLCRRTLEGVPVNAPANADLYLTECYGDWRTPRTAFDCNTDTPNLRLANNFMSLALFLKQYAWSSRHVHGRANHHLATLQESGFIDGSSRQPEILRKL